MVQRRNILNKKKLSYNCTGKEHRGIDCRSQRICQHCHGKHTPICNDRNKEKEQETSNKSSGEQLLFVSKDFEVVYSMVVVNVDGIKCMALLNIGTGSSYISSSLANQLKRNPSRKDYKHIETMLYTTTTKREVYEVEVSNPKGNFKITVDANKVSKQSHYQIHACCKDMIQEYSHLKGVHMDDTDDKGNLFVLMILGISKYTRIKTKQIGANWGSWRTCRYTQPFVGRSCQVGKKRI